ncbi:MAG: hypothetical protein JW841_12490 [Deltaproteobacteria bacterium]|nr:hypothetical protein [Deltaproteobacteria bacterium]
MADDILLIKAKQTVLTDADVRECWQFVVQGITAGWLDEDEINELLSELRQHRDFGIEELMFEHID